jgi:hypothetical protein
MERLDEIIELATRIKELRRELASTETRLAGLLDDRSSMQRRAPVQAAKASRRSDKTVNEATTSHNATTSHETASTLTGKVRQYLQSNASTFFNAAELASAFGLPANQGVSIRNAFTRLMNSKEIVRGKRGKYRWKR